MSGGHWDYKQYPLKDCLEEVSRDPDVRKRWPKTARALQHLATVLADVLHDMDWDLSGDSSIKDDAAFDENSIQSMKKALVKKDPKLYAQLEEELSLIAEYARLEIGFTVQPIKNPKQSLVSVTGCDDDFLVDTSWCLENVKRLPDRTSRRLILHCLEISHPGIKGLLEVSEEEGSCDV